MPFAKATMQEMVSALESRLEQQQKTFVVTANPEIVMQARDKPDFQRCIQQADYITADGIGVVKAAQMIGQPLPERVAGYDMMHELFALCAKRGWSVYMIGAEEEVIVGAVEKVQELYPGIKIVGYRNGFFELDDQTIIADIQQAKPDLVLAALGMARQEEWIVQTLPAVDQGVFIGVGGSFDVLAGKVERAPAIFQKANLEWFYRLCKQPSRWRRMLALPKFITTVRKEHKGGRA